MLHMKCRIIIPNSEMQPLPGESEADAIRRAIVGRPMREVAFERGKDHEDKHGPLMRSR